MDDCSDDQIISNLKTRLHKLHATAAQALSECTKTDISGMSAEDRAQLPQVDAPTLAAFARQLQWDLSEQRAQQFLGNIASRSGLDGDELPVDDFLKLFDSKAKEAAPRARIEPATRDPPGSKADWQRRKTMLQEQRAPNGRNIQKVIAVGKRRDPLGELDRTRVMNLRDSLFERQSNMQRRFKSIDLNDDGVVSLEEFVHALEGSGALVGHEIDRARNLVHEDDAARIMAYFDKDRNGLLNYSEFMRLLQGTIEVPGADLPATDYRMGRRLPELGDAVAQRGDQMSSSNSSFYTTPRRQGTKLVQQAINMRPERRSSRQVEAAFREWDANGDGYISEADLAHVLRYLDPTFTPSQVHTLFQAADANGDGLIDYQEFLEWVFQ